jgi:hypothetical protein
MSRLAIIAAATLLGAAVGLAALYIALCHTEGWPEPW